MLFRHHGEFWENHYRIGVAHLDAQHDHLFSIARRIVKILEDSARSQFRRNFVGKEGIKFLKNYTIHHFEAEEAYMRKVDYPHYVAHKQEHDKFRHSTLPFLERHLIESDYSQESVERMLAAGIVWIINHIARADMAIAGQNAALFRREADTARSEAAICEITINMFSALFALEAKVVDFHYGGEDFGKAVYYERSYESPETRQKVHFIAVLGDDVRSYIGQLIMNRKIAEMDDMAKSLVEEFAFMLMQYLDSVLIKEEHQYKYGNGSFYDRETFLQKFEQKIPEFSILFETHAGKFAICLDVLPLAEA